MALQEAARAGTGPSELSAIEDPGRRAELERTELLDSPPEESFDRLTRLATQILGAPIALVSLVEPGRQFFKSATGLDRRETPLSHSYCQYVVATGEALIITDSRKDSLVEHSPAIQELGVIAYAGIPITTSKGYVLGSFCVIDTNPRQWTTREIALLRDLAALVTTEIEFRLKLREARELWDLGRRIVEPVEGLSDHLATLVRLLDGVDDPRLEHFAMLAESRLRGVQHILGEWQSVEHRFDIPDVSFAATDLARAVKRAVEWARAASSTRGIELIVDDHRFPASCDAGSLEQSITHLLVAALHHSAGMPDLRVHLARQGGVAELEVSTRAVIPAGDLARILARFHRATCEDPVSRRSQKVAVRTIKGSVEAENGPLRVRSDSAHGTRFTLKMPLLADMHAPDTLPTVHLTEPTGAVEASEGARSEA